MLNGKRTIAALSGLHVNGNLLVGSFCCMGIVFCKVNELIYNEYFIM